MSDLDELERLLAAATPGPWRFDTDRYFYHDDHQLNWDTEGLGGTWDNDADPLLIVAAVAALPALIAAARAQPAPPAEALRLLRRWRNASLDGDLNDMVDLTNETTDLLGDGND